MSDRIQRHKLIDRIYHWVMAASIFTLLITAFFPIIGIKFAWLEIHWIAGLSLTVLVVAHIFRALFFQRLLDMVPDGKDFQSLTNGSVRPGKYNLMQKLYHLGVGGLIIGAIGSGLLMFRRIDTPFWRRDPTWFDSNGWGIIYSAHDLIGMSLITMVMIHVYFALRPDEWHLTRSMFRGWITRKEYVEHHDTARWKAKEEV